MGGKGIVVFRKSRRLYVGYLFKKNLYYVLCGTSLDFLFIYELIEY